MKKLSLLLSICLAFNCFGQVIKPATNTYVNDSAGVLSGADIQALNVQIRTLEDSTSVQVAIVLLSKLPDNLSIEDYTLQVGREWHVGNANNGLVYVAAIDQHKQRLEVANKLQGTITDVDALHITDLIKPYFRNKDYAGGLKAMVTAIDKKIHPDVAEQLQIADTEKALKDDKGGNWFMWFMIIISGISAIVFAVYRFFKSPKEGEPEYKGGALSAQQHDYLTNPIYRSNYYRDTPYKNKSSDDYVPPSNSSNSTNNDSGSSSSSSDFGNWGSGSSGSDSSSGFSGGGSSNDW